MTDERFQLYDPEGRRNYLTAQERDAFLAASEHASPDGADALHGSGLYGPIASAAEGQGRPVAEPVPADEPGALGPVGNDEGGLIRMKKTGEDGDATHSEGAHQIGRQADKGPGEDIGDDQIVRRTAADFGPREAVPLHHPDEGAETVGPGVRRRRPDRPIVDIDGQDRALHRPGDGQRQDAGAAAEIE